MATHNNTAAETEPTSPHISKGHDNTAECRQKNCAGGVHTHRNSGELYMRDRGERRRYIDVGRSRGLSGVSKVGGGRNIRLDAAALERRVRGLQSNGDG